MVLAAIGAFLLIRSHGETLSAPPPASVAPAGNPETTGAADVLFHVLLALAAVLVAGRLVGRLMVLIGQPAVIGEILGGIVLGPSLAGRVAPELAGYVLPSFVAPYLGVVAQLGVVVYMFLVGLELNAGQLRDRVQATIATSHASIVAPFLLGSVLALYLYPRFSTSDVSFTAFALFMGVALSITAFPVLARILSDRGMTKTTLGVVALTCAAVDDVTAWCLLALVIGVAQARIEGATVVVISTLAFIAFMFLAVRPAAARLAARSSGSPPTRETVALVLVFVLLSSLTTEAIGVHAIFGAFLFGAVIPHDSALARALKQRLEDFVTILLLPAFFAFTGLRTEIGLVSGLAAWLTSGLIILVATAGKFGGTFVAARLTGLGWREAASLGILMNTRGLMELVVLNVGLDLGILAPTLFAMMVLMALATTILTTPILALLAPSPVGAGAIHGGDAHAE